MLLRTPLILSSLLLLLSGALARAAPPLDVPWPPDESVYEPAGTEIAPGLAIGDVLDSSNAHLATDLLPPEILTHYGANDFRNRIVSWPPGLMRYDKSFLEATKKNEGRYGLDPETGTIIELETGKPPEYIYGLPFPNIPENDPQGGLKALWNQFHIFWNQGSTHVETLLVWASPKRVDRESVQDVTFHFYENQMPRYRTPNPQGFASQSIALTTSPADLQGTVAMSHRFKDPRKRDAVWTYVPALRRVRPVSPANRSDGFLGSDLSQDDGSFFDGKPEDFVWKTVGLREGLRVVDSDSIRGEGKPLHWEPERGWFQVWPTDRPAAGYLLPEWDGLTWAPVSSGLAKRKFWVVEGVPRDRYYLYGRLELWIDAEVFTGAFNRKFSWKGDLLNTYSVTGYLNHPGIREDSDEVEWVWSSTHAWQCAENVKMNRATLAGIRARLDGPLDKRLPIDVEHLFSLQSLSRLGK